ncbi:hypothetical protein FOMPIDRAFT_1050492 [Fomitopsis schrenkii]|uniref:Uncharacterized protein n=1 Tax=Fomitopsis schrenkii TaxID=2126942 RepID=S8E2Q9_FOMSC|nr:hypothetical protein FOMPIDRAFT_1050492 [Fomitopsis schrenkii]
MCGFDTGLQGTVFFGVILFIDIFCVAPRYMSADYSQLSACAPVLVAILLSRFFLNLRSATEGGEGDSSAVSDLRFAVQQSFGGSLVLGDDALEDEAADEVDEYEDKSEHAPESAGGESARLGD